MELEYKRDFEEARKHWNAFWKGENTGRPLVAMEIPKKGVEPVAKPLYLAGSDGNFDIVIDQIIAWAKTHEFLGEAIPYYYVEFGPNHFSSFLGADMVFDYNTLTSWTIPFIKDWDTADIRFRPESLWWDRTVKFIRAIRARCDGMLMIAGPTLSAGLDSLAAIRGTENLLMDMVMEPESVKGALDAICKAYTQVSDLLYQELGYKEYGSINRHGMYSGGKVHIPQCDLSCMISPDMFKEFEVPCLSYEMSCLDAVEYHLDGPGALIHLPELCSIDKLDVVQWVPGDGNAQDRDWTDLYIKIDNYGKGQIIGAGMEIVKQYTKRLKSPKVFFRTSAASREEGERFLEELEQGCL